MIFFKKKSFLCFFMRRCFSAGSIASREGRKHNFCFPVKKGKHNYTSSKKEKHSTFFGEMHRQCFSEKGKTHLCFSERENCAPRKERHICASRRTREAWPMLLEKGKARPMLAQEAKPCFPKGESTFFLPKNVKKHNRDFRFFSLFAFCLFCFHIFLIFDFRAEKVHRNLLTCDQFKRFRREKSNDKNGS